MERVKWNELKRNGMLWSTVSLIHGRKPQPIFALGYGNNDPGETDAINKSRTSAISTSNNTQWMIALFANTDPNLELHSAAASGDVGLVRQ